MSAYSRRLKKAAKKKINISSNQADRQKYKGMSKFIVQHGCGCCDSDVYYRDEAGIKAAFVKAGLSSVATIVDDMGSVFACVDTFYGYRREDEKEDRRGIEYLLEQVI